MTMTTDILEENGKCAGITEDESGEESYLCRLYHSGKWGIGGCTSIPQISSDRRCTGSSENITFVWSIWIMYRSIRLHCIRKSRADDSISESVRGEGATSIIKHGAFRRWTASARRGDKGNRTDGKGWNEFCGCPRRRSIIIEKRRYWVIFRIFTVLPGGSYDVTKSIPVVPAQHYFIRYL